MNILCPYCRLQMVDDGSLAGATVNCPSCRGVFQMPAANPFPPPVPQQPGYPLQPPALPNLQPCPDCASPVSVNANACPRCGCPISRSDATVRVLLSPDAFLIDFNINVVVDGQIVGSGSFSNGIDVTFDVPLGQHSLALSSNATSIRVPFNTYKPGNYRLTMIYSTFWGNFKAGSIEHLG